MAHPEWPYSGTPWEWRGFANTACPDFVAMQKQQKSERGAALIDNAVNAIVYQKQNFGPDLK
jgi:hypothetical protein